MNVTLKIITAIFEHLVSILMGRFIAFARTVLLEMEYHVQVDFVSINFDYRG